MFQLVYTLLQLLMIIQDWKKGISFIQLAHA